MAPSLRDGPGEINALASRIAKPEHVRRALDVLRPGLVADGGNAELIGVTEDGTVRLEFQGACARCPAREMTRRLVLEPALRARVPGVTSVLVS
ncbi:MAG: NifU family protein [Deltaproteobacteria bacterium]|nr:NifU family protein [Deltaproteobacteria bacterium]